MDAKQVTPVKENKSETIDFLEVEVSRNSKSGLRIYLKTHKLLSNFLDGLKRKDTFVVGNVKCFYPINERLTDIRGYFYPENKYEVEEQPNLNLLLSEGIENGVTFDFGSVPISDTKIYDWTEKFHVQVKSIYLKYVKPVNIRSVFTTQTIETEIHD